MKVIVQRVRSASLLVNEKPAGNIGRGLVVLAGFCKGDGHADVDYISRKILKLRIFPDDNNRMNKNVLDIQGDILIVPQFTLYGNCNSGNRPDFTEAMIPEEAQGMFVSFEMALRALFPGNLVAGEFGAQMLVNIANDGPVTLILESHRRATK